MIPAGVYREMASPSEKGSTMNENGYGKPVLDELRPLHRELRHAIPEVYKGFGEFHHAAFAPGALDAKTKELMAFAIGRSSGDRSWRLSPGCPPRAADEVSAADGAAATRRSSIDVAYSYADSSAARSTSASFGENRDHTVSPSHSEPVDTA